MKRFAIVLGAAILAVTAALAIAYAMLPREALKTRIAEQISAWTGRDVSLRGEPQISLFPLAVTLTDVEVSGPSEMRDAALLSTEKLTGVIRLLPLIIGQVEIRSFEMVRPRIRLVRGEEDSRNWAFDSGAAALQLAFAGDVPLGEFVLADGSLVYENRETGTVETVESINVTVGWNSIRQPVSVVGSARWRGELVEITASAADPLAFFNREATPLQIEVLAEPIRLDFTGEAVGLRDATVRGTLALATPSLRRFASWMGSPVGTGSGLAEATLSGDATIQQGTLLVQNAEFAVDGNRGTGALNIAAAAVPTITGTLAFEGLDLTPYLGGLAGSVEGTPADWRNVALNTDWLAEVAADVRLSASSVTAGPFALGQTAAAVSIRDAVLDLGIAEAAFYGGDLSGDIVLADAPDPGGMRAEGQLRAVGFQLAEVAVPLRIGAEWSGAASVSTDLASSGNTLGAFVRGLQGTSEVEIGDGSLPAIGLQELAAAAMAGTGAVPVGPAEATRFSELVASLRFAGERAVLERAEIVAPTYQASLSGHVALDTGTLALSGQFRPAPGAAASAFAIDGSVGQPVVRPVALAN